MPRGEWAPMTTRNDEPGAEAAANSECLSNDVASSAAEAIGSGFPSTANRRIDRCLPASSGGRSPGRTREPLQDSILAAAAILRVALETGSWRKGLGGSM